MLFHPDNDDPLAHLAERIQRADAVTPDLLVEVVMDVSRRSAITTSSRAQIGRLIEAHAWADAALALLAAALPQWSVRRLNRDDGEWQCSLSRQPNLPAALDDTVDAHHELMALAILGALVEARRHVRDANAEPPPVAPLHDGHDGTVCCDDFA